MLQKKGNPRLAAKQFCVQNRQFCGNRHKNSRIDITFDALQPDVI